MVDAFEPSKSNWLRYINMPVREKDENLVAVGYNGEMYYQTTKSIPAGKSAELRTVVNTPCKNKSDNVSNIAG